MRLKNQREPVSATMKWVKAGEVITSERYFEGMVYGDEIMMLSTNDGFVVANDFSEFGREIDLDTANAQNRFRQFVQNDEDDFWILLDKNLAILELSAFPYRFIEEQIMMSGSQELFNNWLPEIANAFTIKPHQQDAAYQNIIFEFELSISSSPEDGTDVDIVRLIGEYKTTMPSTANEIAESLKVHHKETLGDISF